MPELPEAVTSGKVTKHFVDDQPAGSLLVKTIQADATQAEWANHPPGSPGSLGHVYPLESSSTVLRGSSTSQTPIYPTMYSTSSSEAPVPILERGMVLISVETHPRNVLLQFQDNQLKTYWCQVCML